MSFAALKQYPISRRTTSHLARRGLEAAKFRDEIFIAGKMHIIWLVKLPPARGVPFALPRNGALPRTR